MHTHIHVSIHIFLSQQHTSERCTALEYAPAPSPLSCKEKISHEKDFNKKKKTKVNINFELSKCNAFNLIKDLNSFICFDPLVAKF